MTIDHRIVTWGAYPIVIAAGVLLHYWLLGKNYGLQFATFIPVLICATIITVLEIRYPYRRTWQATTDWRNDVYFMLAVQILFPKFLAFFLSITLLKMIDAQGIAFDVVWPHQWPIAFQAVLMLLTADFLRYWLHRAAHEWITPLWRLHAVHHSPKKLYWVNVGRFHPFEKAIQYFFDALPFIILGVSPEVLALYFVFYAVNGFFQHCNINIKLGWLNYIVSGPELHRWHHSREIGESNQNYGNNLIVWDLIFGTYFLPKDRGVDELGLINRAYPLDFVSQMKSPFTKGLDKGE